MISIVLIDPDRLLSQRLQPLLDRSSGGTVRMVGRTADYQAAPALVRREQPDVAIVGLGPRDPATSACASERFLTTVRAVKQSCPRVPILALIGSCSPTQAEIDEAVLALREGVDGLVHTSLSIEAFLASLWAAAAGASVVPRAVMAALTAPPARRDGEWTTRLSSDDRALLRLLAQGLGSADIGRVLFLSERTAKRRIASLLTQLGVETRLEAAALAGRCGLLDDPGQSPPRVWPAADAQGRVERAVRPAPTGVPWIALRPVNADHPDAEGIQDRFRSTSGG